MDVATGSARTVNPAPAWGVRHVWALLGMLLVVAWFPFYAFISLISAEWAVVPALMVWALFFGLGVWWFRRHPLRTLVVGITTIAVWHAAGFLLEALGYTA